MKTRVVQIGILLGLCLSLLCPARADSMNPWPLSGSGTTEDPYRIESSEEFVSFRDAVNTGNESAAAAAYRLTQDITLKGYSCYSVGGVNGYPAFSGVFDGDGHTISNLDLRGMMPCTPPVSGLFGQVTGTVKNLTVQGKIEANIRNNSPRIQAYLGGIAGWVNGGTISYCRSEIDVFSTDRCDRIKYLGGVCGKLNGTVDHCCFAGTLSLENARNTYKNTYVGGIAACEGEKPYCGVTYCCVQNNPAQGTVGTAHTAVFPSCEEETETEILAILNGNRADGDPLWVMDDGTPVITIETEPDPPEKTIAVSADRAEYTYGDDVTLTAETDQNRPGEGITFWNGETVLGTTQPKNGMAVLTLSNLPADIYDGITAGYTDGPTGRCDAFTIKPAVPDRSQISFRLPEHGCVFDGTAKVAKAKTADGLGPVTLYYQNTDDGERTDIPPVSAGTYSVTADVAASQNYTGVRGMTVGTITIQPAEIAMDWNATVVDSRPYVEGDCSLMPDHIHPAFTGLPLGQTISITDYVVTKAAFQDDCVGEKKIVTFTVMLQNTNYSFDGGATQVTGDAEGTITRKAGSVTLQRYDNQIYDGTPVPDPTDWTQTGDGQVTFRWFGSDGTTLTQPPSAVGTYAVQPVMSDGSQYGGAVGEKIEFTIAYLTCGTAQLKGTCTRVGNRRWYHTVTLTPPAGYTISEGETGWQDALCPTLQDSRKVIISYRLRNEMGQISAVKTAGPIAVDNTPPAVTTSCQSAVDSLTISCHADDKNGSGTALVYGLCCPTEEQAPDAQMVQTKGQILPEGPTTFTGLQPAARYTVYITAKDRAKNDSTVYAVKGRTLPAVPDVSLAGIDYAAEWLTFPQTWEGNTEADFTGRTLQSGDNVGAFAGNTVFLRVAAKDGFAPGGAAKLHLPARPDNVAPPTIDYKTETLSLDVAGVLCFESEGVNHPGGTISLNQQMGKTLTYRRAATKNTFASLSAKYAVPARPAAPDPIVVTACTTVKVVVLAQQGCEYRLERGPWQKEPTFDGLAPDHVYRIETRYPATEVAFSSELTALSVTTKQEMPIVTGKLTAVYGRTLAELEEEITTISAEAGGVPIAGIWHWAETVDQSIKPQVGEWTAYEAVFTPERSDCCSVKVSILPEIKKAKSTVSVTDAPDKVFDGVLYRETVQTTVTGSSGEVKLAYFADEACKRSVTPFCAGTYWVRPSLSADRNYNGAVGKAVSFSIRPVLLRPVADYSRVQIRPYDGKTEISSVKIKLEAAEGYVIPDWQYPEAVGRADGFTPNAGERRLRISNIVLCDDWASGYALTTDTICVEADFDLISQRLITLEWHNPASAVYDGTTKTVTAEAVTSGSMEPVSVELTGAAATYAGSYTAEAVGLSSRNYSLPQDGTTGHHFLIVPAEQTLTLFNRNIPMGTNYPLPRRTEQGGVISYTIEGTVPKGVTIRDGILQGAESECNFSVRVVAAPVDLNGDGEPEYRPADGTFTVTITKGEALPLKDVTLYKTYGDAPFFLDLTYAGSPDNIQYTVTGGRDIILLEGRRVILRGAGTATITAIGFAPDHEDAKAMVTIKVAPRDLSYVECSAVAESYTYTGSPIFPTVILTDEGEITSADYTITYGENTTVAKGGTITITGIGRYCGSKTLLFVIKPARLQGTPRFQCVGTTFDTVKVDYSSLTWFEETEVCGSLTWFATDGKKQMKETDPITTGAVYQWIFVPADKNYSPLTGRVRLREQIPDTGNPSGGVVEGETSIPDPVVSVTEPDGETVLQFVLKLTATESGERNGTVDVGQIKTILKQINDNSKKKRFRVEVILDATESQTQSAAVVSIPAEVADLIGREDVTMALTVKTKAALLTLSQAELAELDKTTPLTIRTDSILPQRDAEAKTKSGAKRSTEFESAMQQLADESNPVVQVTAEIGGNLRRAERAVQVVVPLEEGQPLKQPVVLAQTETGLHVYPVVVERGQAQFQTTEGGMFAVIERTDVPVELLFDDIARDSWNRDAVGYVFKNGMMAGTTPHCFGSKQTTTRAMLVTMLYRAAGEPETDGTVFADTRESWCVNAVAWAVENEVVNGFDPETFAPDAALTREQMVTILYRYTRLKCGAPAANPACLNQFEDEASVHDYAKEALAWAVEKGILTGTTSLTLSPGGYAQRDQTAVILMRYLEQHV